MHTIEEAKVTRERILKEAGIEGDFSPNLLKLADFFAKDCMFAKIERANLKDLVEAQARIIELLEKELYGECDQAKAQREALT